MSLFWPNIYTFIAKEVPAIIQMCPFVFSESINLILLNPETVIYKGIPSRRSLVFAFCCTSVNHFELPLN